MKAGDYTKAIKWFEKSHKMYPLPGVTGMIDRCKNEMSKRRASSASNGP
eukprot:CAMPEP_0118662376 /NCGR_PEP_ID=MMETSP0785-20121206/16799_1 /TAXON_ID=91992 /ORGANISM="Bolidomonas pacifica, Strain CCMP 1866" /LENGTH=48 /DNA_ID= /DNA_START= /DNA_END= /DNA_ORIENTATION=